MKLKPILAMASLALVSHVASAVTIDWSTVGNPGNAADTNGYGDVANTFKISTYEITNEQYAEFLNSKAMTDTFSLYNVGMGSSARGGITQSGTSGSFSYGTKTNMGNKPVNFVSFYDAARFVNWLHNGQGNGSTETGAYAITTGGITNKVLTGNVATLTSTASATLNIGDQVSIAGVDTTFNGTYVVTATTATTFSYAKVAANVTSQSASGNLTSASATHDVNAEYWIPSQDEWYKAAYYQPTAQGGDTDSYWLYPTQTNTAPTLAAADSTGNVSNPGSNVANYSNGAVWNLVNGNVTTVGSAGADNFYGTFDQGGNVYEWTENGNSATARNVRGGLYSSNAANISSAINGSDQSPTIEVQTIGFRIATVPEPSTVALMLLGGGSLVWWKRKKLSR